MDGRTDDNRVVSEMGIPEALTAASKSFLGALRRSRGYMLFGIFIGVVCSALSKLCALGREAVPPAGPAPLVSALVFMSYLFDHLAVGFFVSSIAVFFYEWGSNAKHALDLSLKLDELLSTEGEAAIKQGMEAIFGDPALGDRKDLQKQHAKLIGALKALDRKSNRGREADTEFLTLFVTRAATYGDQLKTLREHLEHPGEEVGRPFHLDFTKLDYADKILTHWMHLLGKDDSYVTLSNPRTWSALKSGGFSKAGREAVAKGAQIRRIFIMGRKDDKHSMDDLRNLIPHYQFAANKKEQKSGSYRIQIAGPDVFEPRSVKPENQHYGIFTSRFAAYTNGKEAENRTSVAFKVKGAEVENFELVAVEPKGELERNFEEIWESLESSGDGPIIGPDRKATADGAGRFLDAVMSREVRLQTEQEQTRRVIEQQQHSKLYPKQYHSDEPETKQQSTVTRGPTDNGHGIMIEIVSTLKSWQTQYQLPLFYATIANINVRHLFVLDRGEREVEVEKVTKKQRESHAAESAKWEVKTFDGKLSERTRHWLASHWRLVDADGKALHQCVFTLNCLSDLSDFFVTEDDSPMKAADYARNFTEVWNLAKAIPVV